MDKDVFSILCYDLQSNYGLKESRRMSAFEILGMFLHMLGHGIGNRLSQERFQHSSETVSRYFGLMLDIVCRMTIDVIKPIDPKFSDIPQEILSDSKYMPHFKVMIKSEFFFFGAKYYYTYSNLLFFNFSAFIHVLITHLMQLYHNKINI